jgi:hypothetical protein
VRAEAAVELALRAPHGVHHLIAQLEGRRPRLGVPPCTRSSPFSIGQRHGLQMAHPDATGSPMLSCGGPPTSPQERPCPHHSMVTWKHAHAQVTVTRWVYGMRTHDEAKVNVKQAPIRCEHEIVMVTISNAQDVRHHTVSSAALHKCIQHLCLQPIWPCMRAKMSTGHVASAACE